MQFPSQNFIMIHFLAILFIAYLSKPKANQQIAILQSGNEVCKCSTVVANQIIRFKVTPISFKKSLQSS